MYRIRITKQNEIADYIVPTTWEEVTVAKYAGLFAIPQGLDPLKRAAWMMSYFTGISEEDIFAMRMSEINTVAAYLEFVHATSPTPMVTDIVAGGWTWRRRTSWDNITYGEVTSLQTLAGDNMLRSLPKLLCILLERMDAEGNVIPFDTKALEAEADFAALPITYVTGVLEGFLNGTNS
jgi:hypothetical protein